MENLQLVDEREVIGKRFRIYGDFENPLFLARDVAEWIDYSFKDKTRGIRNTNMMIQGIDEEEKLVAKVLSSGQLREMWMLTEDGLYEVLMQSTKPIAKQFKKEVKEILRSVRKYGAYMTDETLKQALTSPDFIIKLATELKNEKEKNKVLLVDNERMKPKEIFADSVTESPTMILIGELAKILKGNGVETGQNRLFQWMRDNGYLIKRDGSDYNMPTQMAMERGLFKIKETVVCLPDDTKKIVKTVKVTGKGQMFFVNKFLQKTG